VQQKDKYEIIMHMFKEFIPYKDQEIDLEGFIAYPSKKKNNPQLSYATLGTAETIMSAKKQS